MSHILLAEDDDSMRQFLTLALERAGHTVRACENGVVALAALQENITAGDPAFDLLLADIVMPGMDGIELSQKATQAAPTLKVMFITGFAAVALGEQRPGTENAKIMSKPFHLNDLVKEVNDLLAAA